MMIHQLSHCIVNATVKTARRRKFSYLFCCHDDFNHHNLLIVSAIILHGKYFQSEKLLISQNFQENA
jgi:hypothetical protein